jgi:hypothetical protein
MDCLGRAHRNRYAASTCFAKTDDEWIRATHACGMCEGCVSDNLLTLDVCAGIRATLQGAKESIWFPAVGVVPSSNGWQQHMPYSSGNIKSESFLNAPTIAGQQLGWLSLPRDPDLTPASRVSVLMEHSPRDAFGCVSFHCADQSVSLRESFGVTSASDIHDCLAGQASSLLSSPARRVMDFWYCIFLIIIIIFSLTFFCPQAVGAEVTECFGGNQLEYAVIECGTCRGCFTTTRQVSASTCEKWSL